MITEPLQLKPLSPVGGVEVIGLDLRNELPAGVQAALRDAWDKYGLLLLRDQKIEKEDHLRFLRIFGELYTIGRSTSRLGVSDGVSYVSNVRELGATEFGVGELTFHRDTSFYDPPARGISLHAIEIPPETAGGDTLFANQQLAYEKLPPELRERVDHLKIRHQSETELEAHRRSLLPPDIVSLAKPKDASDINWSEHPLAYPHPVTGRRSIFMSKRQVGGIVGLSAEDSQALVEELYAHTERPDIIYRHKWRSGDFILFDNIMFIHERTPFDDSQRRYMRRVLVA